MKWFAILIILLLTVSCSEGLALSENDGCKVLHSDGLRYQNTVYYGASYIYNEDELLSQRERKLEHGVNINATNVSNPFSRSLLSGIQSKIILDSIVHDERNRVSEIYSRYSGGSYYIALSKYFYKETSNKPEKVELLRMNNDLEFEKLREDFLKYDGAGRIMEVEFLHYYNGEKNELLPRDITTYSYNNNLDKITSKVDYVDFYFDSSLNKSFSEKRTRIIVETFSGYTNNKNPYKNLPFIDLRGISESYNLYSNYKKTVRYLRPSVTSPDYVSEMNDSSFGPEFNVEYLTTEYQYSTSTDAYNARAKFECEN